MEFKGRTQITLFLCLSFIASIESQIDTSLADMIAANVYTLSISASGFEGNALSRIDSAIQGSQFILVGEQHGIKEVGQFTDRLYGRAKQQGYHHLALEVSPFMAQELERQIKLGKDSLMTFNEKLPFSIPFYNNQDDVAMLKNALSHASEDYWGLDQVFMVEARFLFHRLSNLAQTESARKLALEYLQKGKQVIQEVMQSGKFHEVLLFQLQPEDLAKLHSAFPESENLRASEIINHIEKTQNIYRAWFEGRNYDNNLGWIELMKENFYNYYHSATAGGEFFPKVLFKFGSYHMRKGLTPVNMFDLGNMAHELSLQNGMHSVHFLFNAIKGSSFNPLQGAQTFDNWDDLDPHIQYALETNKNPNEWHVIDLRPVRQLRLKNIDADLKSRIFAFDFWILVPEAEPLTSF